MPEVLLSGHHENISKWRKKESLKNTYLKRPDLLKKYSMNEEEKIYLKQIKQEVL